MLWHSTARKQISNRYYLQYRFKSGHYNLIHHNHHCCCHHHHHRHQYHACRSWISTWKTSTFIIIIIICSNNTSRQLSATITVSIVNTITSTIPQYNNTQASYSYDRWKKRRNNKKQRKNNIKKTQKQYFSNPQWLQFFFFPLA